jgi:hypothetical protein
MTGAFISGSAPNQKQSYFHSHCEARSDEAIVNFQPELILLFNYHPPQLSFTGEVLAKSVATADLQLFTNLKNVKLLAS